MLNSILNIFFPNRCLACNKLKKEILCDNCCNYLRSFKGRRILCNKPLDEVYAVGLYNDKTFKKIIHAFKYNRKKELADKLGELLINFCRKKEIYLKADKVVPVPLHFEKLRLRKFNQAELLAKIVAEHFKLNMEKDLLIKVKPTPSQSKLSREKRFKNIIDVFKINEENLPLEGSFLIIDDVVTTGATVSECARILKANGAKKVIVLTLAHQVISKNI